MLGPDARQRVADIFERRLPVDLAPLAVLLQQRPLQAIGGVQSFIGKAVTV